MLLHFILHSLLVSLAFGVHLFIETTMLFIWKGNSMRSAACLFYLQLLRLDVYLVLCRQDCSVDLETGSSVVLRLIVVAKPVLHMNSNGVQVSAASSM